MTEDSVPPDRGKSDLINWSEEMEDDDVAMKGTDTEAKLLESTGNLGLNEESQNVSTVSNNSNGSSSIRSENENSLNSVIGSNKNVNDKTIESKNNPRKMKEITRYGPDSKGPYVVYIESKDSAVGRLHKIATSRLIRNIEPEAHMRIDSIASVGRDRIRIQFVSPASANILIESKRLAEHNFKAYIPQYLTRRLGVIRGVDSDISEEELVSMIKPMFGNSHDVIDVCRLKRKRVNSETNSTELISTQSILVSFSGNYLPKKVVIEKIVLEVSPYIQKVRQCLKCCRFNHISKHCKGVERCKCCGSSEHKDEACERRFSPICLLCGGDHKATDNAVCSEFSRQKLIKDLMANENISYNEARDRTKTSFVSQVKNISYASSVKPVIATASPKPSIPRTFSQPSPKQTQYSRNDSQNTSYFPAPKRKFRDVLTASKDPYSEEHRRILKHPKSCSQPINNRSPVTMFTKPVLDSKQVENLIQSLVTVIREQFLDIENDESLEVSLDMAVKNAIFSSFNYDQVQSEYYAMER